MDRLYVKVLSSTPGAVVAGEELPSLPPSMLAVLDSDRSSDSHSSGTRSSPVAEFELGPSDYVIQGRQSLNLTISSVEKVVRFVCEEKEKRILWFAPLIFAIPLFAVIPQFWEVRTYDEFRRGELNGLSVTGDGELVLAPAFDVLFETGEPLIFSAVTDSTGTVYLGTGHDGKVYKVESNGEGSVLADLAELDVLSVAVDAEDTLFAATSPNGKVYRIGPDGSAEPFFEPEATYIWSMVFDPQGRLLVATGDEGVIYRVGTRRRERSLLRQRGDAHHHDGVGWERQRDRRWRPQGLRL